MDLQLAKRLEADDDFKDHITKLVQDYLNLGKGALDYWVDEFDTAHDILMCYAPMSKTDLELLEKGHPKRFVLPMTSTQINTMTTFISQVLFGDEVPHKVEGRGPEDEVPAEHMNQLLRWNAEQQPAYLLGYLWVQDCLTYNRGIFYNTYSPIYQHRMEPQDVESEEVDENGQPVVYQKMRRSKIPAGGYNKMFLVSPYDFYCDPALPFWRLQEHRFCGHRALIPWQELKRRSALPVDDAAYVSPSAVEQLKEEKKRKAENLGPTVGSNTVHNGARSSQYNSRTAYERNRTNTSPTGVANKDDAGICDCVEMWIRLVPADLEIDDTTEPIIFQVLIANDDVILSIGESTYQHDMYPYSVAEGRPSGYYQFSPGWVMHMKALQDYVDYFKNRRQQAIARTLGNIFIARTDQVNLTDFLDPDKEGLIIPVLPEASGQRLDDIVKQVQVNDSTREFNKEMSDFIAFSESVTGVNTQMQGQIQGDSTATEFAGTQQMAAGRLSAVARLLSVQALVPQTKQFVANFQQFLSEPMSIRFLSRGPDQPMALRGRRSLQITPDVLQGNFDFVAHDGSLPGTDNRKVAAIARLLEAATAFPMYFTPAPGNIDARALILSGAKAAGLNVENFQFKQADAPPQAGGPGPDGAPAPAAPMLPAIGNLDALPQQGPGRPPKPDVFDVPLGRAAPDPSPATMKLDLMEISAQEAHAVWEQMPNSPTQRVLHNTLVAKIHEDRAELERCAPDQLVAIQQRIIARRELLGVIHRSDKDQ